MTSAVPSQRIEMIPIDRITVVNPRIRSKRVFKGIVENIAEVGLKRPITVTLYPVSTYGPDLRL